MRPHLLSQAAGFSAHPALYCRLQPFVQLLQCLAVLSAHTASAHCSLPVLCLVSSTITCGLVNHLPGLVHQIITCARAGDTPFIKLIDVGRQLIANRIQGYLNSKIMFFLANHHITPRPSELLTADAADCSAVASCGLRAEQSATCDSSKPKLCHCALLCRPCLPLQSG